MENQYTIIFDMLGLLHYLGRYVGIFIIQKCNYPYYPIQKLYKMLTVNVYLVTVQVYAMYSVLRYFSK